MAFRTANSLFLLAVLLLVSPAAHAEPDATNKNLAQTLFEDARALMNQGRTAEACTRFADSQRLDPAGGTLLNLAVCYEKLGRTATALTTYHEALSQALVDHRPEREEYARQRIQALEPRVPRLTLLVESPPPGFEVRLDGTPVPPSAWNVAARVDPGAHTIDVSAPGRPSRHLVVPMEGGEAQRVSLALEPEPAPIQVEKPPMSPKHPPSTAAFEWRRPSAFYVTGGIALAALATSGITGALALSAKASSNDKCIVERGFCGDSSGVDDASRARTFAWVSTGALVLGITSGLIAVLLPSELRPKVRVGMASTREGGLLTFTSPLP